MIVGQHGFGRYHGRSMTYCADYGKLDRKGYR